VTVPVPSSATVYTPRSLADAMVGVLFRTDAAKDVWLDPCVGDGAFVTALAGRGASSQQILAFDIVSQSGPCDQLATTSRGTDVIAWAKTRVGICDRIAMNPPYVQIGRLGKAVQRHAQQWPAPGLPELSLRANYWCSFVLAAIQLIRRGGALCTVLPASWDYAQYAAPVRAAVEAAFAEVCVLRCARPLFPHVLEGAVVVVAWGRGAALQRSRRIELDTPSALVRTLETLVPGASRTSASVLPMSRPKALDKKRLNELCKIRLGGVTGAAKVLLMSDSRRKELGLPTSALRPVLTRAKHLTVADMTAAQWQKLLLADERVWLFDPSPSVALHPKVAAYLKSNEGQRGYKLDGREPWYRTPLPKQAHAFMSGMTSHMPFVVLNSMPRLTATNTLYVLEFDSKLTRGGQIALGISLLTTASRKALARSARHYADGLIKLEPAELGYVTVMLGATRPGSARVFAAATKALLQGDRERSSGLADAWADGMLPADVLKSFADDGALPAAAVSSDRAKSRLAL